jgi:hypothetical protein
MPRTHVILNAFTGGEVSPEVYGRTDTDQYPFMLEEMRNVIANPRGGAMRRDGLHFVAPCKVPSKNIRLIPFVFSSSQSYVLEFGDQYVRFYRNNGYVVNINGVRSFIGDGTSTKYLYPEPTVAEPDILVLKNGEELIAGTDYTVAPADLVNNQIEDFTNVAAWDLNHNGDAASPWVLAANTAASPTDSEPVLRQGDINIARGSIVDFTFDIDSWSRVFDNFNTTLGAASSLGQDYTEILSVSLTGRETWGHAQVNLNLILDAVQNNTSDVVNARLEYGNATDGWKVVKEFNEIVTDLGLTWTITDEIITGPFKDNDQIRVMAKQANDAAADIIADVGSDLDVDALVDYYAQLSVFTVNAQDEEEKISLDLETDYNPSGTFQLLDREVTNNFPLRLKFQTDPGLQVTISNPSVVNKRDGWEITFTTAPAISDVVVALDNSDPAALQLGVKRMAGGDWVKVKGISPAVLDDLPIYEIESPFTAEQLDDLYFAQANDQMIFCHQEHKPWRLTRYNPYDWRFEQPEFTGAPWEDEQYSPVKGYPRVCTFFQERLYFASTLEKPQTLWGSRAADFYEFTLPADTDPYKADDPVEYTIAAYTHEAIEWMSSERVLVIGTSATEHRLAPDQFIAADRLPTVSRMSAYGGAHAIPAFMGNLTVFIHVGRNQVRTYEQSQTSVIEQWNSIELDWMSAHLTKDQVKQLGYALNPNSILFMTTLKGDLLTMTYEPSISDEASMAWAKHSTEGKFISACTIPVEEKDQIWAVCEREIEDVDNPNDYLTVKYVEYFDPDRYTDATLIYPDAEEDPSLQPPISTVFGLEHLEGLVVTVKVDGATHPDRIVKNGSIELNGTYQNIEVGLRYTPRIKLMRFASAGDPATLQGQMGRWVEVWMRLNQSAYPLVNGVRAAERRPPTPMDTAEPLVTGDVRVYNLGLDRDKQLVIEQDLPVAMHITSLFGVFEVHQG